MTKYRTTHPHYVPPILQGLLVGTVLLLGAAILLIIARMVAHS